MSNLKRFGDVLGVELASYGALPYFLNTTVEDCMCAKGDWLETLICRTERLNIHERVEVIASGAVRVR